MPVSSSYITNYIYKLLFCKWHMPIFLMHFLKITQTQDTLCLCHIKKRRKRSQEE